jgi:ABC-type dipeptide/oligopeptide/nickel transport system ATPase subunit
MGAQSLYALKDIDLDLYPGEVLSIIGESGSGKTTLARSILQREKIQSGRIDSIWGIIQRGAPEQHSRQIQGNPLGPDTTISSRDLYRKIQLVPQATQNSLNPWRRVDQLLDPILRRTSGRGNSMQTARDNIQTAKEELMELCGLSPAFLKRYPGELSGGQRQRVLIARALAMEARLIIFDEPVSSLDVSIQARLLNTLLELKEEYGLSYVFITHDLDIAEYISDRMAIIHNSRILESGPVEEIVQHPREEFTRTLLEAGLKKQNWLDSFIS